MNLTEILENYPVEHIKGDLNLEITGIQNDSRKVTDGNLFIAQKGFKIDGHLFINKAIDQGAIAIIVEEDIKIEENVTVLKVKDTRNALAKLASNFNKQPWEKLKMIGVTGTNGKTSTTYFIKSIFEANNESTGVIGTIGAMIGKEVIELNNTTPDPLIIQGSLKRMVDIETDACIMEVSSHALELDRVEYMNFQVGIFTNLTKDHLDYHETMDKYFNSKLKLFYKTTQYNIINMDDNYGKKIIDIIGKRIPLITYGINENADIYASNIEFSLDKVKFSLNTPKGSISILLNVPGEFSVYNALAAASCAYSYGIELDIIKKGLEAIQGIKGRFEVVPTNREYTVIIDFAHTPDGLEKVLNVIDQFAEGRKIVLFGAGGNRDKTKRPEMGKVVAKHSDLAIVTSDNPRNEEPAEIIEDIVKGIEMYNGEYVKIVDRIEAIKYALQVARAKDIILLAGKGHETYTIIGDKVLPCDERQIVLDFLKDMQE